MMTHNDQTKPLFPLSLDGRGARGEGVILSTFLFALLSAAPAAWADNECGLQTLPATPETVTCAPGDYDGAGTNPGPGITYASDGDLTLEVTDDSGHLDVFEAGINVTGNGGDSVFWDSSAFVDNDVRGTGIVLDYASGTGDIGIVFGGEIRAQDDATHGIRAVSGSGNISVEANGDILGGSEYGIQAETGGGGTLNVAVSGEIDTQFSSTNTPTAIGATTGTGLLTIDIAGSGEVEGRNGTAIRTNAGGDVDINIAAGGRVSADTLLDLTASGTTTVNNAGAIDDSFGTADMAIRAAGGSLVINNDSLIDGPMDLSNLTNGYTFNNNAGATWQTSRSDDNNLGAGALNNAGTIVLGNINVDPINNHAAGVVSAPGTTFTGTGDSTIRLGAFLDGTVQTDCTAGLRAGCLDLADGATAGQTALLVDVNFTELVTGPLTAATSANPGIVLIDVNGGSSQADHFVLDPASFTTIDTTPTAPGGNVDVVLYAEDPVYGAVLDTSRLGIGGGFFDYALLYNPNTQQHLLASVPQSQAIEYVAYIREAATIWHNTTDAVVGRQAALRDGATGKLWARYVGDSTDYDVSPSFTTQGNTFVYDQQYSLDTKALIIGLDLISGDDRVFGVHGGLVDTRAKFETDTSDNSEGITAGLYGGWWHESGLSLDGAINLNALTIDHTVSGDFESGDSDVRSLGARLEAGWRLPLMAETLYVQPLATAAYVIADFDDVELRDNEASFEDTESSRAGLGARLGGAIDLTDSRYQRVAYWLTARAWEEFADEGEARFATRDGGYLSITDDRSGSFEEVDFGVELSNKEGNINVHFAGGVKFGDEIDSSSHFSIGARLNW